MFNVKEVKGNFILITVSSLIPIKILKNRSVVYNFIPQQEEEDF